MEGPQQGAECVDLVADPLSVTADQILDLAGEPPREVRGRIVPTEQVIGQQSTQAAREKDYHLAFNKFLHFIHTKLLNYIVIERDKSRKFGSEVPEDAHGSAKKMPTW